MNYPRTFFSCLVFLFITACDTSVQTAPTKKTSEVKSTEAKVAEVKITEVKTTEVEAISIAIPDTVIVEQEEIRPPLNLSIGDVSFENKKNVDHMLITDYDHTEKNSALFNDLTRKRQERNVNLSGEVLTTKSLVEIREDPLLSVDGIQLKVQAGFK